MNSGTDRHRQIGGQALFYILALATAALPAAALGSAPLQVAGAAEATSPVSPPAGWRHMVEQGVDTYLQGADSTDAAVMVREVPASTPAEVDAVMARLFAAMGCQGAPPASRDGVVAPFGDRTRCFASFARSPGGHRVAVGAATTPRTEAEGLALARRLAAAGDVSTARPPSATPGGAGGDAASVDAALAAALDAVPKRNLPVHMALRQGYRFAGDHMALHYEVWMLFADGFATSCTGWDPAELTPSAETLAAVMEKDGCKATRWRRAAGGAVFDDEPDAKPSALEDEAPPPRGTTYEGDFKSSAVAFSSLQSWGVPGALLINSSAMSLSRDGRFRFGSEQYARNNLNAETRRQPVLSGRYLVDRYLIAIAADGKVERRFFYAVSKPTDKEILFYFDGKLLSNG